MDSELAGIVNVSAVFSQLLPTDEGLGATRPRTLDIVSAAGGGNDSGHWMGLGDVIFQLSIHPEYFFTL